MSLPPLAPSLRLARSPLLRYFGADLEPSLCQHTDISANIGGLYGTQVRIPPHPITTGPLEHRADGHTCAYGSIEWPDFVLQAMSSLKNFAQMNPITLNGLSCVFYGVDFYQQLFSYTLGLLGLIAMLLFPVPCAYLRGFRGHDENHVRWRQTLGDSSNVEMKMLLVIVS